MRASGIHFQKVINFVNIKNNSICKKNCYEKNHLPFICIRLFRVS